MDNNLKKGFLVYTFSNLVSTGVPFLLLPFLTNYLSLEDYGRLSNFNALIALFIPVIGLSFTAAFTRQYYKEGVDINRYAASGINLQLIIAAGISVVLILLEDLIHGWLGIDRIFIRLTGAYCLVFSICELVFTLWRIEDRLWSFFLFKMIRTAVELVLTFFFILNWNMDYAGRVYAILISTMILGVLFVILLLYKSFMASRLERDHVKHALSYGIPLIPHALGAAIIAFSDKLIVTNELDLDANGVYSVAFQVGLIISLIQNSFNQAWVPWFFDRCRRITDQLRAKIVRVTYLYYVGLLCFTAALYLFTPLIFEILGKDFKAGQDLVVWVALGFFFNGMYKMKVNYLFYMEKTRVIGLITILSAGLNIVLNIVLIRTTGLAGAAIATCITFFVQLVFVWIFAQRYFPMPWFQFTDLKRNG